MDRRVGIRFRMEVEVAVSSAWVETHTMKQIEEQSRKDAEGIIRGALQGSKGDGAQIRIIGELGYTFILASQDNQK